MVSYAFHFCIGLCSVQIIFKQKITADLLYNEFHIAWNQISEYKFQSNQILKCIYFQDISITKS